MSIMDIALTYGFSNHESYTRAFKKLTGMTPSQFRQKRPIVGKEKLMTGIYGIGFLNKMEQRSDMQMNEKYFKQNDSTILYGVPRVCYGQTGATPFPLCLKACSDYLGEDIDGMLKRLADENVRKKVCEYIEQARLSDERSLKLLIEADKAAEK